MRKRARFAMNTKRGLRGNVHKVPYAVCAEMNVNREVTRAACNTRQVPAVCIRCDFDIRLIFVILTARK